MMSALSSERLPVDGPLAVCAVIHEPRKLAPLVRRLARFQDWVAEPLAVTAAITASGALQPDAVAAAFESEGVSLMGATQFDDLFFDFSAYALTSARLVGDGCSGAVFVNDTLADKHGSDHLVRTMAERIRLARTSDFPFPLLIGPFRHSEFSVGDRRVDEFVSTFFFFLNGAGTAAMAALLEQLPAIRDALTGGVADERIDPALLRLCSLHALQLQKRFAGRPDRDALIRKLTTAYIERALTAGVKLDGAVWYAASGLGGRLLVPWQSRMTRVVNHLRDRLGMPR